MICPPPFLILLTLLFWGWQTGLLVFAVLMGIALELPRWVDARWDLSDTDFRRVRDLCALLIVGAAVYCFISRDTTNDLVELFRATNFTTRSRLLEGTINTVFIFVHWWPMLLFPLVTAQFWSVAQSTPYHIYSYILQRKQGEAGPPLLEGRFDVSWAFVVLCAISTCATDSSGPWFYVGFSIVAAWTLWVTKPRRLPAWGWCVLFLMVSVGGFGVHRGIRHAQGYVDSVLPNWISSLMQKPMNTGRSHTAIGRIGSLKLSSRIAMWVVPDGKAPTLLRDSSYNVFKSPDWLLSTNRNDSLPLDDEDKSAASWKFHFTVQPTERVTISMPVSRGRGWLALPNGTEHLSKLSVGDVTASPFGTTQVSNAPALVHFTATYGTRTNYDYPPIVITSTNVDLKIPEPEPAVRRRIKQQLPPIAVTNIHVDLQVPESEQAALQRIKQDLGLDSLTPEQRVATIEKFFAHDFSYTTWLTASRHLPKKPSGETALGHFLTNSHSGHCEYFATATVLLLRTAGIPARYANGYSVQERAPWGKQYVVRERHAHAWALYWKDGYWHDLDTTPGSWVGVEDQNASSFEGLKNILDNLWHSFTVWRFTGDKAAFRNYVLYAVGALIIFLIWRLMTAKKRSKQKAPLKAAGLAEAARRGVDSAFYEIERKLVELGLERRESEPLALWLARIERLTPLPVAQLRPLLTLHYRYRFDPLGLTESELTSLAQSARQWLTALAPPKSAPGK